VLNRIERFRTEKYAVAYFSFGSEGVAEAAGEKRIGAQEPRVQRRVEGIIGKGSVRRLPDGKDAGYAADGTLAARSFTGF
jgi:hypothetical protein